VEGFPIADDDPLADAHRAVAAWVEEAAASLGDHQYYREADLKSLASGKALLNAKPEQARRYVVAAVVQTRYWDEQTELARAQSENKTGLISHLDPQWTQPWGRRRQAEAAARALMRRALPFEKQDLLEILGWCNASQNFSSYTAPVNSIVRALERFAAERPPDDELAGAMRVLATKLRSSHQASDRRLATNVEQLCAGIGQEDEAALPATRPRPEPAEAGTPGVLVELKRRMRISTPEVERQTSVIGPDRFPLAQDSPLKPEHELLSALFEEVVGAPGYHEPDFNRLDTGRKLLNLEPAALGRALLAATERRVSALLKPSIDYNEPAQWQSRYAAAAAVSPLIRSRFSLPREGVFDLLLYLSARPPRERTELEQTTADLISLVERDDHRSPLSEGERYVLLLFRASLLAGPALGSSSPEVTRLTKLIGDGAGFCLAPGEFWTDVVNDVFTQTDAAQRRGWAALFSHALTATSARPAAKWLKTAQKLIDELGAEHVHEKLEQWLPLVSRGRSLDKLGTFVGDARTAADTMHEENATCLRGLLWLTKLLPRGEELARPITSVALSAYKKVPGVGPRAVKVGNAAIYALSEMGTTDAVGQLAMLKVRVKFGTAQKEIEKAFNKAAEALGLPRDQIEEMGVPSYGLEERGKRIETLGDYRAELTVCGASAQLRWFDAKGKQLKSAPAKVKSEHKEDLKDLQQSLKDIQGMLPAQRDRIDSMFLLEKSWPIDVWRERYLDHPLVGAIARSLLWCVDGATALFVEGTPTDVRGEPIDHGKTAEITLWHPVGRGIDEITAWRRRLEELQITQPFKQAHREVYLLTDAERNTRTYSNRYAAHVLRQHQFNALCAARGWKNRLRLMVDDSYAPPFKELPPWGLRAEYWVEGIGDDFGADTNDAGVYLRLSTDQVRFYRTGAAENYAHAGGGGYTSQARGPAQDNLNEPLPLEQVPPLVFSEIMRDVDLFVGVASIGNDPTWQDGGPEGRYRDYWQSYSFGELSGTAATRKQVLERLVPRLKIADRCSFSDRFLIVEGKKRTYKIHLGSGNILMEPNDQYLCIVPDSRSRTKQEDVFLPFEGDGTLSIIISKALLLAEDTKIKDPTITRQIEGH
jgi:hypothetical protein